MKRILLTEEQEQKTFVCWLILSHYLFYHIPNGGSRNILEAKKLKKMGVRAGVPDICIPIARGGYHSLYIEMKTRDGGRLSKAQEAWHIKLRELGHRVEVAKGCDEAIRITQEYLNAY